MTHFFILWTIWKFYLFKIIEVIDLSLVTSDAQMKIVRNGFKGSESSWPSKGRGLGRDPADLNHRINL